jgi:hypothetical protein
MATVISKYRTKNTKQNVEEKKKKIQNIILIIQKRKFKTFKEGETIKRESQFLHIFDETKKLLPNFSNCMVN